MKTPGAPLKSSFSTPPFALLFAMGTLLAGPKAATATKAPTPRGNCAVCGMFVANFPDWAAVVNFKDGSQAWFDGPKDLFTYLLDMKRYAAKRNPADIATIQVKDYYALKPGDGRKAYFVLGGDVMGPMGKELVPFASEADARGFLKDHKGQRILSFPEIDAAILKTLD